MLSTVIHAEEFPHSTSTYFNGEIRANRPPPDCRGDQRKGSVEKRRCFWDSDKLLETADQDSAACMRVMDCLDTLCRWGKRLADYEEIDCKLYRL